MDSHSKAEMRKKARQAYRDHYALVRRITPTDRLLEYKLGDGWQPLCDFMGKPVPGVPFPRVNDSEALQEMLVVLIKRGLYNAFMRAVKYTLPFAMLGLGIWLFYRGS
jgi:hypothetical protein